MNESDRVKYVDLDGTLAYYDQWLGPEVIGAPIPQMVKKVRRWLDQGVHVVVFTARLCTNYRFATIEIKDRDAIEKTIKAWCRLHIGQELEVTADKGHFQEVYDDRAVAIVRNTGLSREEVLVEVIADLRACYKSEAAVLHFLLEHLRNLIEAQQ
jgi:hypothetical protein